MKNNLIQTLVSIRNEHNMTIDDFADKLECSADTIRDFENGTVAPTLMFIRKVEAIFNVDILHDDDMETVFSQGYFGFKIPLLSAEDYVQDDFRHVKCYYELPNLNHYGENNLFALHYTGENLPDKGIMHDSILVFFECDRVDRPGVYAIISRGVLTLKDITVSGDKYRIVNLDDKKHLPIFRKTSKAAGRLVSCINNY